MARSITTPGPLWQVSVTTTPEAEAAVAALLEELFHASATVFAAQASPNRQVTVYCPNAAEWWPRRRTALKTGLARIRSCGLPVAPARIQVKRLVRRDWAEAWRRHFKPLAIGRRLLIRPSWCRRQPRQGQAVVTLDPGLSFGTGHHPTTAFCLRQLAARRRRGAPLALLDIGTGSGILAIAAAKLGYTPVRAWDNDPQALRAAQANARRNRVARRLVIQPQDIRRVPSRGGRRYDLVCANLTDDLLLAAAKGIIGQLRAGGTLVLAGIPTAGFAVVRRAYEAAGLRLQKAQTREGWRSGVFSSPGS